METTSFKLYPTKPFLIIKINEYILNTVHRCQRQMNGCVKKFKGRKQEHVICVIKVEFLKF